MTVSDTTDPALAEPGDGPVPVVSRAPDRETAGSERPGWQSRPLWWDVALAAAALVALALCVTAARDVAPGSMGDVGLAPRLNWRYWLGVVLLHGGFAAALFARRSRPWLLTLFLVALLVSVFGAAAVVTGIPRGETTFRHLGIVDELTRTGHPRPEIDAYFSWPGFFAMAGVLIPATGLSGTRLALWAPLCTNLLWLATVTVLLRQLTGDRRLVWLGVWVFASVNWIDQDYFAPQAFAFLLYGAVVALAVGWLRSRPERSLAAALRESRATGTGVRPAGLGSRTGRFGFHPAGLRSVRTGPRVGVRAAVAWWSSRVPVPAADGPGRAAVLVLVVALSATMVVSHQLTPFGLLLALVTLVVVGRCSAIRLPLAVAVLLICWLSYGADAFLAGHPIGRQVGDLVGAAAGNVADRMAGSPGHQRVVQIRMALTAAVWALAAVGVLRRWRAGRPVLVPVLLAGVPFVLVPAQPYGGEMLMRATLFSLPFVSFLAAAALLPPAAPSAGSATAGATRALRLRWAMGLVAVLVTSTLTVGTVIGRYGNARFDMFTHGDLALVEDFYAHVAPGDVLIAGAHPTPWRDRQYADHRYTTLEDLCSAEMDGQQCYEAVRRILAGARSHRGLVLITRANRDALRMQGLLADATVTGMEVRLRVTPGVRILIDRPEGRLYEFQRSTRGPR